MPTVPANGMFIYKRVKNRKKWINIRFFFQSCSRVFICSVSILRVMTRFRVGQSCFTTDSLPPISSSSRQAPWDSRPSILFSNWAYTVMVFVYHPIWRKDGLVVYNCCDPRQRSPAGHLTTFNSPRFEILPTWMARSPYSYPPGTGSPSYASNRLLSRTPRPHRIWKRLMPGSMPSNGDNNLFEHSCTYTLSHQNLQFPLWPSVYATVLHGHSPWRRRRLAVHGALQTIRLIWDCGSASHESRFSFPERRYSNGRWVILPETSRSTVILITTPVS
jgi:hypothetical protein